MINLIFFASFDARAFVVQSKSKALSFNNISRAGSSPSTYSAKTIIKNSEEGNLLPKTQNENEDSDDYKNEIIKDIELSNEPINYSEIADKLIPHEPKKNFYIDMRNKIVQNLSAKPGQSFFIVLPETEESFWKIDENLKLAEIVSSEHNGNLRILEFRALCCGETKFFIDNFIIGQPQVLQSKIIRLKTHK